MKSLVSLLALLWVGFQIGFCQDAPARKIEMHASHGPDRTDLMDLYTFQGIDYYQVMIAGKNLKGKEYSLIAKEIWNGELKQIDTLIHSPSTRMIGPLNADTVRFRIMGQKVSQDQLKLYVRFPWVGIERFYDATESDDYSLRDTGTEVEIQAGQAFPAFAYILPYQKDGYKMWCAVDQSDVSIEDWGKEFDLPHYIIFEMVLGESVVK
ncbi:hypothetical protein [Pontibacter sp. G13]|uniref:hypothetical protein n=1 Tax=Pontibacter sp. G13 TaxID=3074898 RepID=UPI0028890E68|nr:hypothetical protein [Pontibacter sp. G13]WNJ20301.1 hypothetical protein RJD25_07460 [Pontibacter sp. G13]